MNHLAPIVLFVYNRPQHTLRTLEALANNDLAGESVLYIYADGAKDDAGEDIKKRIEETRLILRQRQWCKEVYIIESDKNRGLADSITTGITDIINKYGRIIVLEDDIVTSPFFLSYMNQALDLYQGEEQVMHISGYLPVTTGAGKLPDTFLLRFMNCWGWGTWKRCWDILITDIPYLYKTLPQRKDFSEFNLDGALNQFSQIEDNYSGAIKTWAIKWYATIFLNNGLCLYPKTSLVNNIGFDNTGENTFYLDDSFDVVLAQDIKVYPVEIKESRQAKEYLKRFYIFGTDSSFGRRMKRYLKSTLLHKIYARARYR